MTSDYNCQFKGSLGSYQIHTTEDGSPTLWSEKFDENCHSIHGAYQETLYNYYEGCALALKAQHLDQVNVLDVGWGLGLGLKVLLDQWVLMPEESRPRLHYYSLELDPALVEWALANTFKQALQLELIQTSGFSYYQGSGPYGPVTIIIGNARTSLPAFIQQTGMAPLHAIFQDAFSPRKNAELWTQEWFQLLATCAHPWATLSTYSSSTRMRRALWSAGWMVSDRKGFGHKRSATRACLLGQTDDVELQKLLAISKVLPLSDKELN